MKFKIGDIVSFTNKHRGNSKKFRKKSLVHARINIVDTPNDGTTTSNKSCKYFE